MTKKTVLGLGLLFLFVFTFGFAFTLASPAQASHMDCCYYQFCESTQEMIIGHQHIYDLECTWTGLDPCDTPPCP